MVPGCANVHSSSQFVSDCVPMFVSVTWDCHPPGQEPASVYWTRQLAVPVVDVVVVVVVVVMVLVVVVVVVGGGQAAALVVVGAVDAVDP